MNAYWTAYSVVISMLAGSALYVIAKSFRDGDDQMGWSGGPVGLDHIRPEAPMGDAAVWYRGWECAYDEPRDYWTGNGWVACKGGADLDCRMLTAGRWTQLLDMIDEDEE